MCWLELEYCLCIKHDHVICLRIHSCIILSCAKALFLLPYYLICPFACLHGKRLRYLYYTYTKVNTVSWAHIASPYTIHCPCSQLFISLDLKCNMCQTLMPTYYFCFLLGQSIWRILMAIKVMNFFGGNDNVVSKFGYNKRWSSVRGYIAQTWSGFLSNEVMICEFSFATTKQPPIYLQVILQWEGSKGVPLHSMLRKWFQTSDSAEHEKGNKAALCSYARIHLTCNYGESFRELYIGVWF